MNALALLLSLVLVGGCAASRRTTEPPPEPPFIRHIPADHYLGTAWNVHRLDQARAQALQDAVRQIAQAVGMVVKVEYKATLAAQGRVVTRHVTEEVSVVSEALLAEIPSHIVQAAYQPVGFNRYNAYLLIHFPRAKLEQLRDRYMNEQAVRQRIRAEERGRFQQDLHHLQRDYEGRAQATEREMQRLREVVDQKLREKGYLDQAIEWLQRVWK